MPTTDDRSGYVFPPLEQRGVVAGLRGGQLTALVAGPLLSVGALRASPGLGGVVAGVVVVLLATAFAFVPVGGQPLERWLPVVARFGVQRRAGRTKVSAVAPRLAAPGELRGIRFGELVRPHAPHAPPMAVISDVGSIAAVLEVQGGAFTLAEPEEQERRINAWGAVLAALAREGSAVRRLQWVQRSVPGDREALVRHAHRHRSIDPAAAAARSYDELVASADALAMDHECFVVLAVKAGRRAGFGLRGVDADGLGRLGREVRLLEGQLRRAGIGVMGALSSRRLGAVLRTAYSSEERLRLRRRAAAHPDLDGPLPSDAWPMATETSWSAYRTDEMWHATFWVSEWPRMEVGPGFLSPLLLSGSGARTISLVMAPVATTEGFRRTEAARTAAIADDELRRRAGFLATARRRRERESLAQQEAELADGHAAYRLAGFVTVSASDRDTLEELSGETLHKAHQARLDLRRLYGRQDVAFTWTLPLGRGVT